jgi:hypothetical protein
MGLLTIFQATASGIGLWNAILFSASRLSSILGGNRIRIVKYYFTAQPVSAPGAERSPRSGTFDIAWADADCKLLQQADRPAAILAARFAQGARCLVAANGDDLAGFVWFVTGPYEEDEVRARFVPGPQGEAAWDFDVTIMPQYRMGRLFSYLWARTNAELARCGVRHTMSRISAFNPGSLASHKRLGAQVIGSALFVCVGRLQLMRSSLRPRWHFSWRHDQRPTLVVAATSRNDPRSNEALPASK